MPEHREYGRALIFTGELSDLREKIGVSRILLAEMLGVNVSTVYRWEVNPLMKLRFDNATRVGLWVEEAEKLLAEYGEGIREVLWPLNKACMYLGLSYNTLIKAYREDRLPGCQDRGILGVWVERQFVDRVRVRDLIHAR